MFTAIGSVRNITTQMRVLHKRQVPEDITRKSTGCCEVTNRSYGRVAVQLQKQKKRTCNDCLRLSRRGGPLVNQEVMTPHFPLTYTQRTVVDSQTSRGLKELARVSRTPQGPSAP